MKIGIDARFITSTPRRGIGNYSLNLVAALVEALPDYQFYLYISSLDEEGILPTSKNVTIRKIGLPIYPLWEQFFLPLAAKNDGVDLLHCLGNTAPIFLPKSIKLILSLMDVMFLQDGHLMPRPTSNYQRFGRLYRRLICPLAAKNSAAVITISDFSKTDILSLMPFLKPEKVSVAYLSCDPIFRKQSLHLDGEENLLGISHPYIFCLGAEDPRKNTLRLVAAFLSILKKNNHILVVSGYSNWEKSEAYQLVKAKGATARIIFLPFVDIGELASLYAGADLFIYPSLYEGFGIPIIEAFSAGCPVIASDSTSIPEVGGDAVIYVDPLSEVEIANAIQSVVLDSNLRKKLKELGLKRAEKFSWGKTAAETYQTYQKVSKDFVR